VEPNPGSRVFWINGTARHDTDTVASQPVPILDPSECHTKLSLFDVETKTRLESGEGEPDRIAIVLVPFSEMVKVS
jgi:hypothetical protein